jgi:hypothetical protein
MDFARPVSFKNADIGHCADQKPREDEGGVIPAEVFIQPQPVPTPAFSTPTPALAHVSVYVLIVFKSYSAIESFSEGKLFKISSISTARTEGKETCL